MKSRCQAMLSAAPLLIAIGGGLTMHAPSARAQAIDPYAVPPAPPTGAPDDIQTIEPPARTAPAQPATGFGPARTIGAGEAIVPPRKPSCTGAACDDQPVDAAAPRP